MPTIGWFEILIVVAIAIVVLGPKDFPIMLKKAGSWIGTAKRYVSNIQNEVSNLEIDEENDRAESQCYVTVFQQTDDFPLQAIFCGHYFDCFVRVEGVWQFSQRIIKHMMVGDLSAHLNEPESVVGNA